MTSATTAIAPATDGTNQAFGIFDFSLALRAESEPAK
jgi:hypothetical protein